MVFKKTYTIEKGAGKEKDFWEDLNKAVKRESMNEIKTYDDELRVYESTPLFSVRGRIMKEKSKKALDITLQADSRKEQLSNVVFGIIGLYALAGLIGGIGSFISTLISGIILAVIYWYGIQYYMREKEKGMMRTIYDYTEDAARKNKIELE